MHYCTRPKASCTSASGIPWHLRVIVLTILSHGLVNYKPFTSVCLEAASVTRPVPACAGGGEKDSCGQGPGRT